MKNLTHYQVTVIRKVPDSDPVIVQEPFSVMAENETTAVVQAVRTVDAKQDELIPASQLDFQIRAF